MLRTWLQDEADAGAFDDKGRYVEAERRSAREEQLHAGAEEPEGHAGVEDGAVSGRRREAQLGDALSMACLRYVTE